MNRNTKGDTTHSNRRADEQCEHECHDIMVAGPEVDVDGVEDGEEGEAPRDAVNDDGLARGEELVDDRSEEEEVDYRPAQCVLVSI